VNRHGALGIATLVCAAAAVLAIATSSNATFRGQNGRLVFEAPAGANRQLFTIEPDGTGLTQVTHFKDSGGTNASWSKDARESPSPATGIQKARTRRSCCTR
jgi:hypothetical protein